MLSSGAIRARIAAVVESLCRTAVSEITKVVEDGLMVLRLETVYRESEIKRLRADLERLHVELRAGQDTGATPRRELGARENLPLHSGDRNLFIVSPVDSNNSVSMVQRRDLQDRLEDHPRPHEPRDGDQTSLHNSHNSHLGQSETLPLLTNPSLDMGVSGGVSGGPAYGYSPYQGVFRAEPRREKALNICPYCGKCFERAAHLERHKRIHTGEKPYQCETCGRCFNQNCSLKEHRKLHFRDAQLALQKASEENLSSNNKESIDAKPNLNPNFMLNPNPNLNPDAKPNLNPNFMFNPNPNPNLNPDSKPNLNPNFILNPNPNLNPDRNPNPNPNFNPNSNFNFNPNPNLNPDPNPNSNLSPNLNPASNPAPNPNPAHSDSTSPEEPALNAAQPPSEDSSSSLIPASQIKPEPVEPSIEPPQIQQITINHSHEDGGGDLSDRLEPLLSFPILNPISPPLPPFPAPPLTSLSGALQPYYMKDGQLLDMQKRTPRPKRMYPCQYCPKVFGRGEHLERHVRIHTGEKPFGCYICGRCFSQKSSLKGHMRTHGHVSDMSLGDGSLLDPPPMALSSSSPAFMSMFDPGQHGQDEGWPQLAAAVKLEPKEEPLDPDYVTEHLLQGHAWTSVVLDDPDVSRADDMDFHHEINIEIIPNNHHHGSSSAAASVKSEGALEEALEEAGRSNGDAFEMKDVGGKPSNSYICSVCGENYDDFNLFQKHECSEEMQQQVDGMS